MQKTIGTVGIDVITINHFRNIPAIFSDNINDLLAYYRLPDPSQDPHITLTKNMVTKVTISGAGFQFSYGNHFSGAKKKAFAYLALYASNGDGDNLTGLSMQDVWDKMSDACSYLYNNYNILLSYDPLELNVANIELNVTIPLSHNYEDYSRVLGLIENSADKKEIKNIREKDDKGTYHTTHSILGAKSTTPIKLYNKTNNQKNKKNSTHPSAPVPVCDTFRYEVTLNKIQSLVSFTRTQRPDLLLNDNQKLPLCYLDDSLISDFFVHHTKGLSDNIQSNLRHKQDTTDVIGFIQNNKGNFSSTKVSFSSLCNCIADQTIEGILQSTANEMGYTNSLAYVRECLHKLVEKENTELLLLDITDLQPVIKNAMWIRNDYKDELYSLFVRECNNNLIFHKKFTGQRALYEEIVNQLICPMPQVIDCD